MKVIQSTTKIDEQGQVITDVHTTHTHTRAFAQDAHKIIFMSK